jgi:hypothetical protein
MKPTIMASTRSYTQRIVLSLSPMKAVASCGSTVRDLIRDVDRSLLRENLKLTPEERLAKFASFMRFIAELRRAGENARRNANSKT